MKLQEIVQLQIQGRFAEAQRHYELVSEIDPANADLLNNLALIHAQEPAGHSRSLELLRQSLYIRANSQETWGNYCNVLIKANERSLVPAAILSAKSNGIEVRVSETSTEEITAKEAGNINLVALQFQQGFYLECARHIQNELASTKDADQHLPTLVRSCAAIAQLELVPRELSNPRYLNQPKSASYLEALARYSIYTRDLGKAKLLKHLLEREHPGSSQARTIKTLLLAEEAGEGEEVIQALDTLYDPSEAEAQKALKYFKLGNLEKAREAAMRSLAWRERQPRLLAVLCNICEQLNDHQGAEESIRRAIRASSQHLPFWAKYTELLKKREAFDKAKIVLQNFVAQPQHEGDLALLRSGLAFETRDYAQAKEITEQLIQKSPQDPRLTKNMGLILLKQENRKEALEYFDKYLEFHPEDLEILNAKASTLIEQGQTAEAKGVVEFIFKIDPENFTAKNLRAGIHIGESDYLTAAKIIDETGNQAKTKQEKIQVLMFAMLLWNTVQEWSRCVDIANQLIKLDPRARKAYSVAGAALRSQSKFEEATELLKKAREFFPADADLLAELGTNLCHAGRISDGVDLTRQAVESGASWRAASALCFWMTNDQRANAKELFRQHQETGQAISNQFKPAGYDFKARPANKRIRIGLVSGDLNHHAVGTFVMPLIKNLDKTQFELFAYYNNSKVDAITKNFKGHVESWRDVHSLNEESLSRLINQDAIDILIDLSGHTSRHRLPVFAMRSAPVQISMIGYFGTTGLKEMDYYLFLGNGIKGIDRLQHHFTENLLLCDAQIPYEPWIEDVALTAQPKLASKLFTFGSFNRLSKISDATTDLWISVLKACPESRLIIGGVEPNDHRMVEIKQRFENAQVVRTRIEFRNRSNMTEYLSQHNEIDLLLDTTPYSSGTTAHHAIWMGVPTLTLPGETLMSRQCEWINQSLGLSQFNASSADDFVKKAIAFTENISQLSEIRGTARAKLDVGNPETVRKLTAEFERALKSTLIQ